MSKTIIEAGGGLILNESEEVLMIYRRGFWDLPKGKLDEGESIEECAVREVMEECGLSDVWIGRKLCTTTHFYKLDSKEIEKHTHWYLMLAPGSQPLVPQTEEDIERSEWVNQQRAKELLEESYPTIREVFIAFSDYYKTNE